MGPYRTLCETLRQAPSIGTHGVTVLFGEENIIAQDVELPFLTVVPIGGPWEGPGYDSGADENTEMIWATKEGINIYLSAWDPNPEAQPEDHADRIDELRGWLLQALQFQRMPGGLFYKPVEGQWTRYGDAKTRFGRGYVLRVIIELAEKTEPPNNVTPPITTTIAT